MLITCWSAKGGVGTTVVACSLALLLARSGPRGAVVVDLAGDVPAALGAPDPAGPGAGDWLSAAPDVGADALGALAADVGDGLAVIHAGVVPAGSDATRTGAFAAALRALDRPVVVDCGVVSASVPHVAHSLVPAAIAVASTADVSLLVLRPCFLALRRALGAPLRADAAVVVSEPHRVLGRRDIEDALGIEVRAEVEHAAGVARAVDAGLLASRFPRPLERALRGVV